MARQTPTRDGSADGEKKPIRATMFFFPCDKNAFHGVVPSIAWFFPFKTLQMRKKWERNQNEARIIGFCASVFEIRLDPTWKFECEMPCMALLLATKHPP